jgi:hypothetical protein
MKRVPTQVLVYGDSFTVPIITRPDVEYLLRLISMKIEQ